MFSKGSRYKNLKDLVNTNARGQKVESKALRLNPERTGEFLHSIEEPDRLDHLAHKFYKKSKKWWQICDANPEGAFPPALLGKDPIKTSYFPVDVDESIESPDWASLLNLLRETVGVESALLQKTEIEQGARTEDSEFIVTMPRFDTAVSVRYNTMNVDTETVLRLISELGFQVRQPEHVGRIGRQIVIPRNSVS